MGMLKDLLTAKALEGKRTKWLAFLLVVVLNAVFQVGWIDQGLYQQIMSVLVGAGLIAASVHKPTP